MELKIIDSRAFEKLIQAVKELLEKTNRLNSSGTEKEWLDNQDVCILLGISLRTLQTYRDKKLLPYSQVAHKCYYKAKDIQLFIEKNKVKSVTK